MIKNSFKRIKNKRFAPISDSISKSRTHERLSNNKLKSTNIKEELMIISSMQNNQQNNVKPSTKNVSIGNELIFPKTTKNKINFKTQKSLNRKEKIVSNISQNSQSFESSMNKLSKVFDLNDKSIGKVGYMEQKYFLSSKSQSDV